MDELRGVAAAHRGQVPGHGHGRQADRAVDAEVNAPYTPGVTVTATSVDESDQLEPQSAPASRWAARLRRLVPAAAAALSGVLLYVSFPPRTLWWLALPGLRRLRLGAARPRLEGGASVSAISSASASCCRCWCGPAWRSAPGPGSRWSAIEAVFVALVGVGVAAVSKLPGWPVWAAAVWIAGEAARARVPFSGFPWGKIAFGQADGVFLPLAAVGGTPVLGFAVVLCGFGLYEIVRLVVRAAADRCRTTRRPRPWPC